MAFNTAVAMQDWATVYKAYPDEFKAKCPLSEYASYVDFINDASEYGIPEGATYVIDDVRIQGDYGWVYSHFVKDGRQIFHDTNEHASNEPAEAVWLDGEWELVTDPEFLEMERPCSLEPYMGRYINLPLPTGSSIELINGRINIADVVRNATRLVLQENQFNDPPSPGSRFYMLSLLVEHDRVGSAPFTLSSWNFKLIGDKRKLYDSGCGVIPSELYAELYPGGTETGNVCFEVEDDDNGFMLIYSPSDEDRVFLKVE